MLRVVLRRSVSQSAWMSNSAPGMSDLSILPVVRTHYASSSSRAPMPCSQLHCRFSPSQHDVDNSWHALSPHCVSSRPGCVATTHYPYPLGTIEVVEPSRLDSVAYRTFDTICVSPADSNEYAAASSVVELTYTIRCETMSRSVSKLAVQSWRQSEWSQSV